ncbi:MAG: SpoVA/SpoVAEb family sporulation membrane protein [Oscillospiraceae bacterium]|jgi:stage V sporulation protein AC|nr:SpoVA/SpoVAEb family sporulation membrane protein [Oscillospiraceae bacterium]
MEMTNAQYGKYVKRVSPKSRVVMNTLRAFVCGGAICCIGQLLNDLISARGATDTQASTYTSIILIFIGSLLTALHLYDRLGKFAGGGTLVPITGFSNSVTSAAIEFKSEGIVTGMSTKMFIVAGPVLVFGILASVVYGLVLWVFKLV